MQGMFTWGEGGVVGEWVGNEWEAGSVCMKMMVLRKPSFLLSSKVGSLDPVPKSFWPN